MRKLLVAATVWLAAGTAAAANIDTLKSYLRETSSASARFTQIVYDRNNRKLQETSGTMQFSRPGRIRWAYEKPYEQLIVGDGAELWVYDKDLNQVTVKAIGQAIGGSPAALLAGSNDIELLRRTGVGRDINRHYYTTPELQAALTRPVVQSMLSLLRLRNSHRAFGGVFQVEPLPAGRLVLRWTNHAEWLRLEVDLSQMRADIVSSGDTSETPATRVWSSSAEA